MSSENLDERKGKSKKSCNSGKKKPFNTVRKFSELLEFSAQNLSAFKIPEDFLQQNLLTKSSRMNNLYCFRASRSLFWKMLRQTGQIVIFEGRKPRWTRNSETWLNLHSKDRYNVQTWLDSGLKRVNLSQLQVN